MDPLINPQKITLFFILILATAMSGCTDNNKIYDHSSPATIMTTSVVPQPTFISPPSHTSDTYRITISRFDASDDRVIISNTGTTEVSLFKWIIKTEPSNFTYTFPVYSLESGKSVTVFLNKTGQNTQGELYVPTGGWERQISKIELFNNQGNRIDNYGI